MKIIDVTFFCELKEKIVIFFIYTQQAMHPITDIRFSGPRFDDTMQQMTQTFTTNDCWDSDIEDSNSSEEFLYAKGSQIGEYLRSRNQNNPEHVELVKQTDCNAESGDEQINTQNIWNSHEDLIAVTTKSMYFIIY